MGYSTEFYGRFSLNKRLAPEHHAYLRAFATTRRMKRDPDKTKDLPDPVREAAGLPLGPEAGYFVGAGGDYGQAHTDDIVDYNRPPGGQPSLWCLWEPSDDGNAIEWNGGEKFYDYIRWIGGLIDHFLRPWGYSLDGSVEWQGEDRGDFGTITVRDNVVVVTDQSTHGRQSP